MNRQVITQLVYDDVSSLLCPRCGEDYLHHGTVQVFARQEDAAGTHTTAAPDQTVRVDHDMAGNPSSRRHGVSIAFYCEQCDGNADDTGGGPLRLTIAQHKGQTFLAWEETP